ncbi:MAG: hypothetical protein RRZ83_04505 [Alistipes sp.]
MQVKKILINIVALAVIALPCRVVAQSSSINAFSPYSMYGIGELNTPGTLPMRSMGGVGVATRGSMHAPTYEPTTINLLNPAAFSTMTQKSFLFDFGVEGQNFYNSQKIAGERKNSAHNTFNFHEIAFLLPLAKGVGLGFGLTPYSSVGYRVKATQINGNFGWADYSFEGEGDVTEVKAGIGWEVFRNFSIGAAMQYYWGDIDRKYTMTPTNIVDNAHITPTIGLDMYSVSRVKGQFGVQWSPLSNEKRALTLGVTYDIGGDLSPRVTHNIRVGNFAGSSVKNDDTHMALSLPHQLAAGVNYRTPRLSLGMDYVYQNWRGVNQNLSETTSGGYKVEYANTSTFKLGVEYTPNYTDMRHFMRRIAYRAGVRYGDYNQTFNGQRISQYAVTLGIGIPVRFLSASAVDIGFEYGSRGANGNIAGNVGFIKQQYFKFAIGFSIFSSGKSGEYWFVRPKYD